MTNINRTTRAEVEQELRDVYAPGSALARIIDLHVAHEEHAEWAWAECEGCDAGEHAEGPASWPCSTVEAILGYTIELVANRDPVPPRDTTFRWVTFEEFLTGQREAEQAAVQNGIRNTLANMADALARRYPAADFDMKPVTVEKHGYPVTMGWRELGVIPPSEAELAKGQMVIYGSTPEPEPGLEGVHEVVVKHLPNL